VTHRRRDHHQKKILMNTNHPTKLHFSLFSLKRKNTGLKLWSFDDEPNTQHNTLFLSLILRGRF
jgi:hypothetical protein